MDLEVHSQKGSQHERASPEPKPRNTSLLKIKLFYSISIIFYLLVFEHQLDRSPGSRCSRNSRPFCCHSANRSQASSCPNLVFRGCGYAHSAEISQEQPLLLLKIIIFAHCLLLPFGVGWTVIGGGVGVLCEHGSSSTLDSPFSITGDRAFWLCGHDGGALGYGGGFDVSSDIRRTIRRNVK